MSAHRAGLKIVVKLGFRLFGLLWEVVWQNKDSVHIDHSEEEHSYFIGFELQNVINVGLAKRVMH